MKTKTFFATLAAWIISANFNVAALSYDPFEREDRRTEPQPEPVVATVIPPDPEFLKLQEELRSMVEAAPFDIAISVTDLQTGQTIHVKGDEPRLLGCTVNFFVLLNTMRDLERGQYPGEEVEWSITQTTTFSNATTARWLIYKSGAGDVVAGMKKINALLGEIGLKEGPNPAEYNHPPAYGFESVSPDKTYVDNILTPNQATTAWAKFYRGEILTPKWQSYLFTRLTQVDKQLGYLIVAGVDKERAIVAHKNGFYWDSVHGWVDADTGIVVFEAGGKQYAYAIAIYAQDVWPRYADVPLAQKLSRLVWEFFVNKYR